MPQPVLNNVQTQATYVDALTVEFMYPREGFTVQVYNGAVYYQTAIQDPTTGRGLVWEGQEHFLAGAVASFSDTASEGWPPNQKWAGFRVRSANGTNPAMVSVA